MVVGGGGYAEAVCGSVEDEAVGSAGSLGSDDGKACDDFVPEDTASVAEGSDSPLAGDDCVYVGPCAEVGDVCVVGLYLSG